MPRSQSLPVNNPHAPQPTLECISQEIPQRLLGLDDRQAVEIDLCLHPLVPTAKLLEHRRLYAGAVIDELIASSELRIARIAF